MVRLLCALLVAFLAFSCQKTAQVPEEDVSDVYQEFIITKGSHSALKNDYRPVLINKLSFKVLFDSSCIYATVKEWNAEDVNKLYGFSDCNTGHHENSARFGWRWNGQAVELFAYCYVNSNRTVRWLAAIPIGHPVALSIRLDGNNYEFEVNGVIERMSRNCSTAFADGYQLYPYFGGDETAPHDIRILIKDLK